MKKRILALLTVLVLVLALSATAFAAQPSALISAKSKNQVVKAGKTINFTFTLKSGKSYTKQDKGFRAKLDTIISKDGTNIANSSWAWSGTQKYRLTCSVAKKAPAGKYTLAYTVYYRKQATNDWTRGKSKSTFFTVVK